MIAQTATNSRRRTRLVPQTKAPPAKPDKKPYLIPLSEIRSFVSLDEIGGPNSPKADDPFAMLEMADAN